MDGLRGEFGIADHGRHDRPEDGLPAPSAPDTGTIDDLTVRAVYRTTIVRNAEGSRRLRKARRNQYKP